MVEKQASNSKWKVETTGIDIVSESDRTGSPIDLFWVWSAANIGILGIVYGAIVVGFGLSFIQSILVTVVALSSFALVGYSSCAGKKGRTSTLTLSREVFGIKGNVAPTMFSWFNLMGWEVVNLITGTLTLAALFQILGAPSSVFLTLISLVIFSSIAVAVSLLGQATVVVIQRWFMRVFGSMTLIVAAYITFTADWASILSLPSGSWVTGFLPAVSVIVAGTGISWAIAGADYSRYQGDSSSNKSIFFAVVSGATLPLGILIFVGILLSVQLPGLAVSDNPIALIGGVLPPWMAVPYLLAAVAGITTAAVLSLYSASLNFLTMGIKVKQSYAVAIDSVIVVGLALYILFVAGDFIGPFIAFLIFCGIFLASWAAIFILDYIAIRRHIGYDNDKLFNLSGTQKGTNIAPIACWGIGSLSGLLVSNTGFINGFLAVGIFAESSLGLFVAFAVSITLYGLFLLFSKRG